MNVQREQIPSLVADGMNGLQELLTALSEGGASSGTALVESYFARFKLWAGSLGAHRVSGSRSLQYRLRDASSIRTLLISLLEDLSRLVLREALPLVRNGLIQEVGKEDDDESDTEELTAYFNDDGDSESDEALGKHDKELNQVFIQIGGVIDCLLRLSVTISNPAPHDRFKSRAGRQVGYYESWDIQHVLAKFPHIDTKLAERLGRALTQRRKYFKYREDHHCRLKEGINGDDDGASKGQATTLASSLPLHLKDKGDTSRKMDLEMLDDDRSELSATSYAPSTVDQSDLRVPHVPKEYVEGPFLCPFCYVFITVDNRYEWKKHVFRDLRPYVCLSAACVAADQDFQRRKDWSRHMSQEHWRQWPCPLGCAANSSSPSGLRRHLKDIHGTVSSAKNVDFIISQSSISDPQQSHGICPLCNDVDIKSNHQYRSHVGHHLEQLALFVLPAHEDDPVDEEDENSDKSARDTEEEDEISTQNGDEILDVLSSYWSVADQSEFLDLLKRFGPDWLSISRHMKTKTETMVRNYFNRKIGENPQWQQIAGEASSSNATAITESNPTPESNIFEEHIPEWDEIEAVSQALEEFRQTDQGTSGSAQRAPMGSSGTIELYGGLAVNGRPAELISIDKDGRAISLATGEVVDMNENIVRDFRTQRTPSEVLAGEQEIERSMARRRENASPEELAPRKCREPGCTREFERLSDWLRHEKAHSRPWKCPIESCKYHEYGWPTEKEVNRHINDKHSIDPPMYKCWFAPCSYRSKRESNCKRHMEKAHGWRAKMNESNEGGSKTGSVIDETPPSHITYLSTPDRPKSPPSATQPLESHPRFVKYVTDKLETSHESFGDSSDGPLTNRYASSKDKAVMLQAPDEAMLSFNETGSGSHISTRPAHLPPPVSVNATKSATTGPIYTRMARRHLSIEALRAKSVEFELDANPEYVLIRRWVPPEEQKELWAMTKAIRDDRERVFETLQTEDRGHYHDNNKLKKNLQRQ